MELAPSRKDGETYYKGGANRRAERRCLARRPLLLQPVSLVVGIIPQFVVPSDKIGIRIALSGDELPEGQILAEPGQKGILREVLKPKRYPYNPYAETIELHDLVTVPAGFRGVVTLLSGTLPKNPNIFLVEENERGVQAKTLEPGTYPLNLVRDPGQPGRLPVEAVQPVAGYRDGLPRPTVFRSPSTASSSSTSAPSRSPRSSSNTTMT